MQSGTFTTFDGARRRFSREQVAGVYTAGCCVVLGTLISLRLTLMAFAVLFLLTSASFLLLRLVATLRVMAGTSTSCGSEACVALPLVTLLCPLYKEPNSIKNLSAALQRLNYPTYLLDIIFLLEADDLATQEAARSLPSHFRILVNHGDGPKTKPNALNMGLRHARGNIVGVYDAEDRPEPEQLRKMATAFASDQRIGCVQAQLNFYNRDETILTRMFALEYSLHFDYMLPGMVALGLPIPLGGTSNFVRRDALLTVGGWDAFNVTEDADLGLRLSEAGYTLTTITSSTFEEATENPRSWTTQRSRWIKGFMQTWFVHTRTPLRPKTSLVLHTTLGAVVFNALAAPFFVVLFAVWVVTDLALLNAVFGGWLKWPSTFLLIGGNGLHAWLLIMAPLRRGWFALALSGLMLPAYWVLQSAAAYRALISFIRTPYYWAKTDHSAGEDPEREAHPA
ncbi:MAG: glycosyltransferase [Pseudomonadota bacterium]